MLDYIESRWNIAGDRYRRCATLVDEEADGLPARGLERDARTVEDRRGPGNGIGSPETYTVGGDLQIRPRIDVLFARGRRRTRGYRAQVGQRVRAPWDCLAWHGAGTVFRRAVSTPIIAFAKDWHEDPTSNHHVLRELARTRRVLWLNSIATRTPKLSSGRDLGKIRRKVVEFVKGPVNVENDLWVMSPLALPLPGNPTAAAINRTVLRTTIRALRRRLGIDRFQLWTFLPNTAPYVGTLGEDMAIYYCVDEWSLFSYLDREQTVAAERALLGKVDAVFAINAALADAKRPHNPRTFVSPHGVDHALFAQALDPSTVVPSDIDRIPHPRLGFYGTLRDWVDFELLAHVARKRPAWQIVLIGQQLADLSSLEALPNVHLLGQKPHHELPAYCKGFDVGMIPYRIDERMTFVNPLKLREYLSTGLPVVSTPVPEVARFSKHARVASTADEFVAACEAALRETSDAERRARSEAMKSETWSARVQQVAQTIDEMAQRKNKQ